MQFKLKSKFRPTGDQPVAIEKLIAGLNTGVKHQTLLGATGSGKTFTIANVIEQIQKPTLVISHNKTLAAQLYQEFKEFFPENAVHYFVSYYDYYQPEAYIPQTDTYIEKDAKINEAIDALRHASTASLLSRQDVIIVASVSCIYGLGSPEEYAKISLEIKTGDGLSLKELTKKLILLQYARNPLDPRQGHFRVRENTIEIHPPSGEEILSIEFEERRVASIKKRSISLQPTSYNLQAIKIFPAKHFITPENKLKLAVGNIRQEFKDRLAELKKKNFLLEAQRLKQRTEFDLEMLENMGYVNGIENYSRHLDFRQTGTPPFTLLDYFHYARGFSSAPPVIAIRQPAEKQSHERDRHVPTGVGTRDDTMDDFLTIIDESHATIPQLRGMYFGDRSRKNVLIEYGFRLPSARDNRPLTFAEFNQKIGQTIYVSATPSDYELRLSRPLSSRVQMPPVIARSEATKQSQTQTCLPARPAGGQAGQGLPRSLWSLAMTKRTRDDNFVVEQLIRPTGILDPQVEVRPTRSQIKDVIREIRARVAKKERSLILTLTKRLAEDIADYLKGAGIKTEYLHSEIKTFERTDILKKLRLGEHDAIVGINLLREGLDLPEVSFIAILDADKEGFLRNRTTLLQIIGRAARHTDGKVIMYADAITGSMKSALQETKRRRQTQENYNRKHKITPQKIEKEIRKSILEEKRAEQEIQIPEGLKKEAIKELEREMKKAVKALNFERAAEIRDQIKIIKNNQDTRNN